MAWNQPGNNGERPNPWGGGGNKGGNNPPGLDDLLKKLNGLFGGGSGGGSNMKETDLLKWALGGIVALWLVFGFYTVKQAEEAVIYRFGKVYGTQDAGLHWNPPLIDRIQKVNTQRVEQSALNATMITEDANIVEIALSVQYRISDPRLYYVSFAGDETRAQNRLSQIIKAALSDEITKRTVRGVLVQVGVFALIFIISIAVTAAHLMVKRWLQLDWRSWLTERLVGRWMDHGRHYHLIFTAGEHDNPDGRIAEDIRIVTETAIALAHSPSGCCRRW